MQYFEGRIIYNSVCNIFDHNLVRRHQLQTRRDGSFRLDSSFWDQPEESNWRNSLIYDYANSHSHKIDHKGQKIVSERLEQFYGMPLEQVLAIKEITEGSMCTYSLSHDLVQILGFPCFKVEEFYKDADGEILTQSFVCEQLRIPDYSQLPDAKLFDTSFSGYIPLKELVEKNGSFFSSISASEVHVGTPQNSIFELSAYSDYKTYSAQQHQQEEEDREKRWEQQALETAQLIYQEMQSKNIRVPEYVKGSPKAIVDFFHSLSPETRGRMDRSTMSAYLKIWREKDD